MKKQILIIQGHPDKKHTHFCHALAVTYKKAAEATGHSVKEVIVADIEFPLLRSKADFDHGEVPPMLKQAQEDILWADHLVIIYPLWLGAMPALLKGFLEQIFRPGFGMQESESGYLWEKLLKNKTARIIVTMGMPAFFYRWFYRAHTLKNLQRNILKFCGVSAKASLIGMVDEGNEEKLKKWLPKIQDLAIEAL